VEYSHYGYIISHLVGILAIAYNLHIIYMFSAAQCRTSTFVDVRQSKNFDVRRRAVCEWALASNIIRRYAAPCRSVIAKWMTWNNLESPIHLKVRLADVLCCDFHTWQWGIELRYFQYDQIQDGSQQPFEIFK